MFVDVRCPDITVDIPRFILMEPELRGFNMDAVLRKMLWVRKIPVQTVNYRRGSAQISTLLMPTIVSSLVLILVSGEAMSCARDTGSASPSCYVH